MAAHAYTFQVVRGVQAGHAYYVTMCPLRMIPRLFLFDEEELSPELRAQRTLNKARVPEIARYITENRGSYVFSSLTASIGAEVRFAAVSADPDHRDIGLLTVPGNAKFIVNDGQHRRAAIEAALRDAPDLADECISVVFFIDPGVQRAQQMFTDLNRHAVRPSRSLGLLYDQRDSMAVLSREVVKRSKFFPGLVEFERTTLAERSSRLFTLSAIETATTLLVADRGEDSLDVRINLAVEFWDAVSSHIPEWQAVKQRKLTAGDVRRDCISAHGIALSAIAYAGRAMLAAGDPGWKRRLQKLDGFDWSRANASLWEGRALVGGKLSKAHNHVRLTACAVKYRLELPLSPEEHQLETSFRGKEAQ